MKKYITVMASFAAMAAPFAAGAAFHEILQQKKIDARPAMREEMKTQMTQEKEEMKGQVKEMRDAMKEKMDAMRKEMQAKRDTLREEIKKKREEFQAKAGERREALKKKIGEERAKRIEQFFAKMTEKFENAIDRLEKVADRLEDRLNASTAPAVEITPLKEKLAAARIKITAADAALADAKVKYAEAVKDTDLKAAFRKVHDIVQATTVKVREAHQALVEATAAIKAAGSRGQNPPATPVPSQNQ